MFSVGEAVGSIALGSLSNVIGTKRTMQLCAVCSFIGSTSYSLADLVHLQFSPSLAPYVATPRLIAVLEAAFGSPGVGAVTTTAQVNLPGLPMHTWHPDDPGSALDPPQGREGAERWPGSQVLRPRMINVLFFLTDFTPENGGSNPPAFALAANAPLLLSCLPVATATFLLPRSHRRPPGLADGGFASLGFQAEARGDGVLPPPAGAVHAAGPAGAACLFDCRLWVRLSRLAFAGR